MGHYLYKLIPPRPTFMADMTADEAAIMEQHFDYWTSLLDGGAVVAYGPVNDPAGGYGLAILEADTEQAARNIGDADPAVAKQLASFQVFEMPATIVRA
jgi:uncharacterized protein YciI